MLQTFRPAGAKQNPNLFTSDKTEHRKASKMLKKIFIAETQRKTFITTNHEQQTTHKKKSKIMIKSMSMMDN